jgi:methylated-DNA-protein-cysteine methyltransferase-like protein
MVAYDPDRHGPDRIVGPGFHRRVWDIVRRIPAGRVASYGDVAQALGNRSVARHVGWALAALSSAGDEGGDVPWWRVVAATGQVRGSDEQAQRLAAEGVRVAAGRVVGVRGLRVVPAAG